MRSHGPAQGDFAHGATAGRPPRAPIGQNRTVPEIAPSSSRATKFRSGTGSTNWRRRQEDSLLRPVPNAASSGAATSPPSAFRPRFRDLAASACAAVKLPADSPYLAAGTSRMPVKRDRVQPCRPPDRRGLDPAEPLPCVRLQSKTRALPLTGPVRDESPVPGMNRGFTQSSPRPRHQIRRNTIGNWGTGGRKHRPRIASTQCQLSG